MGRLRKKFDFLAELSSHFPDYKKPILVGGSAVEFYTRRISKNEDMDLIADRSVIIPLLLKQNFQQDGRFFYRNRIFIEIPSNTLHGKSVIVKYRKQKIRIICVEDLVVDRLCACKHWNSVDDCEQAQMLIRAYTSKIDWNYINRRAEQEDVVNLLR